MSPVPDGGGTPSPGRRRRWALHSRILAGLVLGAAGGVLANALWHETDELAWTVSHVAQPVGQVFLRLLFMVVVPLVVTSLVLGVAGLGDVTRLGRVGVRTLLTFLVTTAVAASLGILLVDLVRPGDSLDPAIRAGLMAEYGARAGERVEAAAETGFGIHTFVQIVPRNPLDSAARGDMLGLIFFSLVFGVALLRLPAEVAAPVLRVLEGVAGAVEVMIGFAMRLAPYGVAGLIFAVTARFGFQVLESLALYVAVVLGGLVLHQAAVLPALARRAGVEPRILFRRARAMMVTAFSTSSSNATLPTTLRTAQDEFGVPREVAGFVLPLGATMNMNGTALFEGVTVLFLAQAFGIELGLATQVVVMVLVVLTSVGASGVPSGSIPLLILVLDTVGVPGEAIALVLGVDRLLDMARTVPNVTGDLVTSLLVARGEGWRFDAGVTTSIAPGPAASRPDGLAA